MADHTLGPCACLPASLLRPPEEPLCPNASCGVDCSSAGSKDVTRKRRSQRRGGEIIGVTLAHVDGYSKHLADGKNGLGWRCSTVA